MADYSGALKKFRDSGYSKDTSDDAASGSEPDSVRNLKLTDDEAKELQSYQKVPGEEQTCQVTGKLEGNTLRVMSVTGAGMMGPDMDADAEEAMSKYNSPGPMVQSQTVPSPS